MNDFQWEVIVINNSNFFMYAKKFDCGNEFINKYLLDSKKYYENGESVTKIFLNSKSNKIMGFYSLSASTLLNNLTTKTSGFPAVEIKMFAVDKTYQDMIIDGELLSDALLSEVIKEIYELSEVTIGVKFIILNSVPDAIDFYLKNGFNKLKDFMSVLYYSFNNGCEPMYFEL